MGVPGSTIISIILITAHDEEAARSRMLQAGVVDGSRNPFSEEALLDAIRSVLESDHDGTLQSSKSPTRSRQEMAGRRSRMAASTTMRRFERLQVSHPHPKDVALHVILSTSSVNIAEE
jgi:DNA-binding response OmpR family regulator